MSKYDLQAIREKMLAHMKRYREQRESGAIPVGRSMIEWAHDNLPICHFTTYQQDLTADLYAALHEHFIEQRHRPYQMVEVRLSNLTGHGEQYPHRCGFTIVVELEPYADELSATTIHITDSDPHVFIRRDDCSTRISLRHPLLETRLAEVIRMTTYSEFPLDWRSRWRTGAKADSECY
jgi:hypothetical protein